MAARVGLRPWERDRMTPAEVRDLYDGHVWRVGALAWGVHLLMAAWVKKAPSAEAIHAAMVSDIEGDNGGRD